MTYTQYLVMMVLWEYGGMTEGELGKKIRPESTERKLFLSLAEQGQALKEKAVQVPAAMHAPSAVYSALHR